MTPPPIKPIPVRVPWMIRLKSAVDIPIKWGRRTTMAAPSAASMWVRISAALPTCALDAQDAAENDGDKQTYCDAGHLDVVGKTGN